MHKRICGALFLCSFFSLFAAASPCDPKGTAGAGIFGGPAAVFEPLNPKCRTARISLSALAQWTAQGDVVFAGIDPENQVKIKFFQAVQGEVR